MLSFDSDGVGIAYSDEGEGEPILLIHGFASNVAANWRDVGWIGAIAFVFCLLATLYPAWRAARTHPAAALRYE